MESKPNCKTCETCPAWPKSLFKSLTTEQLQLLEKMKSPNQFKKNEFLFKQGENVTGIFCNADGLIKTIQTDRAEKIKFSRLVYPGDSAGHRSLFIEEKYKGSASVVSETANVCFISKEIILSLLTSNNEFAKNLIYKLASEIDQSISEQIDIKERSLFSRLCSLLLDLFNNFSEKNSDGQLILKITISKVEIARLLSVADETVIRMMSELKSESVIDSNGKTLILVDQSKLTKLSLP